MGALKRAGKTHLDGPFITNSRSHLSHDSNSSECNRARQFEVWLRSSRSVDSDTRGKVVLRGPLLWR